MSDSNSYIAASQSIDEKKYWLNKIASDWERTIIEKDNKSNNQDTNYDKIKILLPDDIVNSINKLSGDSITKFQVVLTAGLAAFLLKYLSKNKVTIGTTIDKQESDANFINTILPLCFNIDQDNAFKEILMKSRDIVKQALENQNYPLSLIAADLDITKEDNENLFFDIGIIIENIHDLKYITNTLTSIIFCFKKTENNITGEVIFNKNKYSSHTVNYLIYLFTNFFEKLLLNIDQKVGDIQLLPDKDQQEYIAEQNEQSYDFPLEYTLVDHIRNQVLTRPDAIAIGFQDEFITFKEIDERSNIIANALVENKVNSKDIVAVFLDRSHEVIICMLGVLKAGCAYLPIELDTPIERINYILNDCNARIILTDSVSNLALNRNEIGSKILIDIKNILNPETKQAEIQITPDLPAYLIYTSGSTGRPKGVLMNHRSIVNFIFGMHDKIYSLYDQNHVFGLVSPFVFDASVQLTYGALIFGYKLQILSNYERAISKLLLSCIEKYQINVLDGTPVHLNLLLISDYIKQMKSELKHIIIGGDVLYKSKIKQLYDSISGAKPKITNVYGPTECCVNATFKTIAPEEIDNLDEINIGKPLPNYKLFILDQKKDICPIGVSGEIYIGGKSLAMKYVNNEKLTSEKFVENPFSKNELLYKTGDLGKRNFKNEIDFIGRSDHQVKIRGYRIELGEIEENMLAHPNIDSVVCMINQDDSGDKNICSFFISDIPLDVNEIQKFLVQKIPHFMIPAFMIRIDEIPLTSNGKVDRKALLKLFENASKNREFIPPRNDIESSLHKIWLNCLKLENVSIDDNFFNIGGDSIRSIYLLDTINKEFESNFKIADIYQNDTIEKFAQLINEKKNSKQDDEEIKEIKEIESHLENFKTKALDQL